MSLSGALLGFKRPSLRQAQDYFELRVAAIAGQRTRNRPAAESAMPSFPEDQLLDVTKLASGICHRFHYRWFKLKKFARVIRLPVYGNGEDFPKASGRIELFRRPRPAVSENPSGHEFASLNPSLRCASASGDGAS